MKPRVVALLGLGYWLLAPGGAAETQKSAMECTQE